MTEERPDPDLPRRTECPPVGEEEAGEGREQGHPNIDLDGQYEPTRLNNKNHD